MAVQGRLRPEDLRFDPPQLPLDDVERILDDHWALRGTLVALDGERDQNTRVTTSAGDQYVLKIATPSEDHEIADLQCAALAHIAEADPQIPVPRVVPTTDGESMVMVDVDGQPSATRLLSYLPGITFGDVQAMPLAAIEAVGEFQGRLALALRGFEHRSATAFMAWSLDAGMLTSDELWDQLSPEGRAAIDPLRERAVAAAAALRALPRQVLHNDGHGGNLLRRDVASLEVTGVIDFGDIVDTAVIADLAVCAASFGEDHPDPVDALSAVTRGYHRWTPLSELEVALLVDLIVARRVLGTLLVEYQTRHAPPDRLDEIAGELPVLRAGARFWSRVDRAAVIDSLVACVHAPTEDPRQHDDPPTPQNER